MTAFVAVVIGASAIGDEREDGTILYLVATPLPRAGLVLTKVLASWTAAGAARPVRGDRAGSIALGSDASGSRSCGRWLAVALSAFCYCAVAAWLSMITRRPVVIGVLYILLWEGSIATFAASADRLSIAAYGRAIAVEGVIDVNAPGVSALGGRHRARDRERRGDLRPLPGGWCAPSCPRRGRARVASARDVVVRSPGFGPAVTCETD